MSPDQTRLAADPDVMRVWLSHLYAGRPGLISICSDADRWEGRRFETDETGIGRAVEYAMTLERRRPKGIYAQTTTLRERPAKGRGGEDQAHAVTHLWADGDYGAIGHKPGPDDYPAPPDAETVAKVVADSGLPAPSGWTYSGGGHNPVWMLAEPYIIGDDTDRARIKELTTGWQAIIAARAYLHGWSWDTEVGNLDRLMKLPGSINRKEDMERPTSIGPGSGVLYDLDDLIAAAEQLAPAARTLIAQAAREKQDRKNDRLGRKLPPPRPARAQVQRMHSTAGPLDVLADTLGFPDILGPAGFTYEGQHGDGRQKWLRPAAGSERASSAYSLLCDDHVAVNWSERADLPVGSQPSGRKLTIGTLYAHLNYAGNTAEAARDVLRAAHGKTAHGAAAQLPVQTLEQVRLRCGNTVAPPTRDEVDWSDLDIEPPSADEPPQPETPRVRGLLPDEFYKARPELQHIRQAGHSRNRSGDVAFIAVLTRLSSIVSHRIRADTGVAGYASLNLFGGIIGPSGIGKSTGVEVASLLLPTPDWMDFRDGLPIGSGEGMAEIFMDTVDEETGEVRRSRGGAETPVTQRVRKQVRHNAFFYVDEGATLTRLMKERSGSTLGETLRSAAVGATLGQTNASKDTSRYIPSGSYSMGLLVGFQPETAAPLFEEVAEGTPQRFVWVQVIDPSIPDLQPTWPGELVDWRNAVRASELTLVSFEQEIKDELRRADLAKARGETTGEDLNPLDSHAPLIRVKVASLLAILGGRQHVTPDDWRLAEMVWRASCATRDAVVAYSARQRHEEQEKRTAARIVEEVRVDQAKVSADAQRADKAVLRIATRVADAVHQKGPLTRSALRANFASRDKPHLSDAYAYAELREWVVEKDGRFAPGPVRPD